MHKLWFLGLITASTGALAACSDHLYDPGAPAIDPDAPSIRIASPPRGTFAGNVKTLVVTGTATDDSRVASVQVNGVEATLDSAGAWAATIPLGVGTQLIHAVARDAQGNLGKESRAVVAGPMRPIATGVPRAITARVSAQTFDAISRGATGFVTTGDLAAIIAPHNPVIAAGDGPDCLFAHASITRMSVGSATTVSLTPTSRGLALAAELDRVSIGMHLRYAAACFDGSRDISIAASHIRVAGTLSLGVARGAFDIELVEPDVAVTGFDVDLGGLPDDVVDLLHLDSALGSIIGWATETFVVPLVNRSLGALADGGTVSVLGTPVDIAVTPARIRFDATGAVVELDSALRARGDTASPGYVYVSNQAPAMSAGRGFELAIADDAANQLLGSFWAARGMEKAFDLTTGSYGNIGQLYDRVELSAELPPYVDASDGSLELTIGDLIATFKRGATVATRVAVNAEVELQVTTGADGKPRLDVGAPTTYVDILDASVDGANALSHAQFEAITSFALARVIAIGSGAVGAVPLPSFGGVAVRDVGIAEHSGYVVVEGNIQ
jgi:hypothetical protein